MRIMIDIETFSVSPRAEIRSIGACDIDNTDDTFHINVNGQGCGYDRSEETVDWWRQQDEEVQKSFHVDRKFPSEAVARLAQWFDDVGYSKYNPNCTVWACGPQFDIVILEHMYSATGIEPPWKYSQVRDFRTVRDSADYDLTFKPNAKAHDALADAQYQSELLVAIENA